MLGGVGATVGRGAAAGGVLVTGRADEITAAGLSAFGVSGSCATGAATVSTAVGVSSSNCSVAAAFFAAFLTGAFLTAFFAGFSASSPSAFGAAFLTAAFFAAFFTGLGSSGCTSRTKPSRSARRRTRSACASMTVDDCVLTAMPNLPQRSSIS